MKLNDKGLKLPTARKMDAAMYGGVETTFMATPHNEVVALVTAAQEDLGWTDAVDDEEQHCTALGTDQHGWQHRYVMWGTDNLMPVAIANKVGADETVASSLESLKRICYGGGVKINHSPMVDCEAVTPLIEKAEDWLDDNDGTMNAVKQAKNLKMWWWNVDVICLNTLGNDITDFYTRDVEDVRLAPRVTESKMWGTMNIPAGHVPFAYVGKFNQYQAISLDNVEVIPLLDERTSLRHLRVLMGIDRDPKTGNYLCDDPRNPSGWSADGKRYNYPTCRVRKFGILRRIPALEKRVYPIPSWAGIIHGSWYKIKHSIEVSLMAKIRNNTQIKYLVTIHPQFWTAKLNQYGIKGGLQSEEGKQMVANVQQEIIDNLCGSSNANKPLITGQNQNPTNGAMEDLIKVTVIDNKTQGGDWAEDITEATNMLCYGMGIHPSLVGAVPGKSGNNNSGSDKREMYTIAQANEISTRDIMLSTYRLILKFKGWWKQGVRCSMPFMQLTTLDEHTSAKSVDPKTSNTKTAEE